MIPGNHDIPKFPPWRFTRTFDEFDRVWGETEPTYRSERLIICGLNSVRPWKQQGGALRSTQVDRARRCFAEASDGALRVAVLHHHLLKRVGAGEADDREPLDASSAASSTQAPR